MRTPCVRAAISLLTLIAPACVNTDPQTGENIPRGNQRHTFDDVEKYAEQLKDGMSKTQAMMLLGSPAEQSDDRSEERRVGKEVGWGARGEDSNHDDVCAEHR